MRLSAKALGVAILVVAAVGAVDAAIGRDWDLVALFITVAALQALAVVNIPGDRVFLSVRADLARWATQRSKRTGEPVDDVIDRSLAWFQHGLYRPDQPDDG